MEQNSILHTTLSLDSDIPLYASLGSRAPTGRAPVEILRLMMPTSWA